MSRFVPIWVCATCYDEAAGYLDPDTATDALSAVPEGADVVLGLPSEDHACYPGAETCGCETDWSGSDWACDGCGAVRAGVRFALTLVWSA